MTTTSTDRLLKKISSGAYRDSYLIYARKSTDEPENQKNSIEFQRLETNRFASRERLKIADLSLGGFCRDGVIAERHSAFKESEHLEFGDDGRVSYRIERPKFHQLAQLLGDGAFKGAIFLCWDRASRNKGDELILRKLMKAGVDFRFVHASYDDSSAGELHKDIDSMFAEHHSRITREKVKDAIDKSREKGWCTHKAPVGYLNPGSMQWKPQDPERAPLILAVYEYADQTGLAVEVLRRWLIDQGFTMPPVRRPRTREEMLADEELDSRTNIEKITHLPSRAMVHTILTNPFYTGKTRGPNGTWIKSTSHEAIVSQALFDRVQAKLAGRRTGVRYHKTLPLPFRGFARHGCGRVYTPYVRKGITYFGAHCDRDCPYPDRNLKLDAIQRAVWGALASLIYSPEELDQANAHVCQAVAEAEEQAASKLATAERRRGKLRADLAYLTANRLTLLRTNAFSPEALAAEEVRLATELEGLEGQRLTSTEEIEDTFKRFVKVSELLLDACICYELGTTAERERLGRIVISELIRRGNVWEYKARNCFAVFEQRIGPESAPSSWVSELVAHSDEIAEALEELEAFMKSLMSTRP